MTLNTTSDLTRTKRSLLFDKLGLQPSRRHFFWISRAANIVIVILKIGRMRYGHNLVMLAISAIEDWPSPNEFGLLNDMLQGRVGYKKEKWRYLYNVVIGSSN